MRAQELQYLGLPGRSIDAQLQNIFNDGKWRHLRWQGMLLAAGLLVDIEYQLPWPAMKSKGSVDGVGEVSHSHPYPAWRGKEFGFELKGISTFQFAKIRDNGPLDKHLKQVHRYFLSGGFDLFVIVYEDKTTQAFEEFVIEPDQQLLAGSKRELVILNEAIAKKELHGMLPDCQRARGPEWQDCAFGGQHGLCQRAGLWPRLK